MKHLRYLIKLEISALVGPIARESVIFALLLKFLVINYGTPIKHTIQNHS